MVKQRQRLVIVDGNALIHRSFHALPPLTTKQGELINAVYGFTTVLLKMFRELKPTHVVVCFDRREKTFREKEYADYKATRVKAPQELYDQIPKVKELVESFNIPALDKAGYEADDLIGTITRHVRGVDKIIVTGDMDTLQLVDDETSVYTLRKGLGESVTLDPAAVKERFGITPEQLIDFKALRGDPSDNIPGVKGVGEKTAAELLQEFGTIEKLYAALAKDTPKAKKLKPGLRERLLDEKQNAWLSKRLATIVRDVPVKFTLNQAARKRYDRQQVTKLFQGLGFTSLLSKLPEDGDGASRPVVQQLDLTAPAPPPTKPGHDYELVADEAALDKFLKLLKAQDAFTLDTETTSLDPLEAKLLGISFSWEQGRAYFVSLQGGWLEELRPVLESNQVKKHGHNIKYDYRVLMTAGVELGGLDFDTMVASYLLNPGSRAHGLDQLVFEEFGYEMMPIEALIGPRGKNQLPMQSVPVQKLSWYSGEDADYTERLYARLSKRLKEQKLDSLFRDIEMPLVPVLGQMEQH
ncbi:MAG: DNA polymerase I, partial [Candidatus Kerfeldbacteria bacterium]|nr:DNA polymerase I [Candidatus Kerfeldbacteria bacterium]